MKTLNFARTIIETLSHIVDKVMYINIQLKIKLPSEPASPFSMIFIGFVLIFAALVINIIIRHIALQRLIEDPYLNIGVYFVLTQLILFNVVGGVAILFKGIENLVKRL